MTVELHLGDCLEVMKSIPDKSVDAVITDPPYGIDYQSARRTDTERKPKIENDKRPFIWWLHDAFRITKDGGALLCFCDWRYQDLWKLVIEVAGWNIKSHVIWDRDWHGLGNLNSQFAPQHDIIWFATKGKFAFQNGRPKDVIRSRRLPAEDLVHPNEKPKELMGTLTKAVTISGATVFDPFLGSGTTGVACVQTGRNFIGIEICEDYFKIAQKRIADAQQQPMLI